MQITIRPTTGTEHLYAFTQSSQIASQTGCLGHLRADFGPDGNEFHTSWFDHRADLKTDAFKAQFNEIVEELRRGTYNGKLLSSRANLARFCFNHPSDCPGTQDASVYRFDVGDYAFLMRLNSNRGDYNVYIYVYTAKWLDKHLENARKRIRFINPHYTELFRIADGDRIRILYPDGKVTVRICRFIDDYHVEVGNSLYHICEFAENMEVMKCKIEPVKENE